MVRDKYDVRPVLHRAVAASCPSGKDPRAIDRPVVAPRDREQVIDGTEQTSSHARTCAAGHSETYAILARPGGTRAPSGAAASLLIPTRSVLFYMTLLTFFFNFNQHYLIN